MACQFSYAENYSQSRCEDCEEYNSCVAFGDIPESYESFDNESEDDNDDDDDW